MPMSTVNETIKPSNTQSGFNVPRITGKFLLALLCFMLLIHIVVFGFYARYSKHAEAKVNHDIMAQQVLNLIERIYSTQPALQAKVAGAVDISNVSISVDKDAKWKVKLPQNVSLWIVNQEIQKQRGKIQVSLALAKDKWLNISANIVPTSWWLQIFLLSLEIIAVSAILISFWSINRFVEPLKQFRKAADRLGIDVDPTPLAEYGPTIAREAAHAMNKMQARIRSLITERTQMLAALSHDLRTPITRMKLRAQFINDQEQYQKTVSDLDEMEQMIAETLAFAKSDSNLENKVRLDLNSLLASITDDFQDVGHHVTYQELPRRVLILGRSVALKRAFNNLIENAIKYAGSAEVTILIKGKYVIVNIDDNGPGIAEGQLEKVFAPFYRGEASRSRDTGGTGLGLAVTRDIIRAHGGTVKLSLREQGGLRAQVVLPAG